MKSSALRVLGGPWFTDDIADLGSKDAVLQTKGAWIIELAELDSLSRADVSKIKGFMSRTTDRIRPPYGRRLEESPRQCVFAGSVNHSTYLRDETGGRRFWPVQCSGISIEALLQDRDQLWAEAVVQFHAGAKWWLDTTELIREAEREQYDRFEADPWQEHIVRFIEDRASTSIDEILGQCLVKLVATWTQADKNRISRILTALGWERKKVGPRLNREWRYVPIGVSHFEGVSHSVSQSESTTGSPEMIDAEALLPRVSQCPGSEHAHT
jgi:predicted P-loop ATPase